MPLRRKRAFTLAEVLIALALLGIVAAFAIPKVLQSTQDGHKRAVLKETLAAIHAIEEEGRLTGALTTDFAAYFFRRLNAVKTCTNAVADNCWIGVSPTTTDPNNEISQEGAILPNGVTLCGFDTSRAYVASGNYNNAVMIDWNGLKPPNVIGDDQLWVAMCYGTAPCTNVVPNLTPGKLLPPIPGAGTCITNVCGPQTTGNLTLYNWVIQN